MTTDHTPKLATVPLSLPSELHPDTKSLVLRFAEALAKKLTAAQVKYGYSNGWLTRGWIEDGQCAQRLREHVEKGDPRDVAAYCAMLWHHEASTIPPKLASEGDDSQVIRDYVYKNFPTGITDRERLMAKFIHGLLSVTPQPVGKGEPVNTPVLSKDKPVVVDGRFATEVTVSVPSGPQEGTEAEYHGVLLPLAEVIENCVIGMSTAVKNRGGKSWGIQIAKDEYAIAFQKESEQYQNALKIVRALSSRPASVVKEDRRQWIDALKSPPTETCDVLFVRDGHVLRGTFQVYENYPVFTDAQTGARYWHPRERVTYWMPDPLPVFPPSAAQQADDSGTTENTYSSATVSALIRAKEESEKARNAALAELKLQDDANAILTRQLAEARADLAKAREDKEAMDFLEQNLTQFVTYTEPESNGDWHRMEFWARHAMGKHHVAVTGKGVRSTIAAARATVRPDTEKTEL